MFYKGTKDVLYYHERSGEAQYDFPDDFLMLGMAGLDCNLCALPRHLQLSQLSYMHRREVRSTVLIQTVTFTRIQSNFLKINLQIKDFQLSWRTCSTWQADTLLTCVLLQSPLSSTQHTSLCAQKVTTRCRTFVHPWQKTLGAFGSARILASWSHLQHSTCGRTSFFERFPVQFWACSIRLFAPSL